MSRHCSQLIGLNCFLMLMFAAWNSANSSEQEVGKALGLRHGARFEYELSGPAGNVRMTTEIKSEEPKEGRSRYRVTTNVNGIPVVWDIVSVNADGLYLEYSSGKENTSPVKILEWPIKRGAKWKQTLQAAGNTISLTFRIIATDEVVQLPAGRFNAVVIEQTASDGQKQVVSTIWYALQIGMIKQTVRADGVEVTAAVTKHLPPSEGKDSDGVQAASTSASDPTKATLPNEPNSKAARPTFSPTESPKQVDPEVAEELQRITLDIQLQEKFADRIGGNESLVASSYHRRGEIHFFSLKDYASAATDFEKAIEICEKAENSPECLASQRKTLCDVASRACWLCSRCWYELRDFAKASKHATDGAKRCDTLLELEPGRSDVQILTVLTATDLAKAVLKRTDVKQSEVSFSQQKLDQATELATKLARSHPAQKQHLNTLAELRTNLSELKVPQTPRSEQKPSNDLPSQKPKLKTFDQMAYKEVFRLPVGSGLNQMLAQYDWENVSDEVARLIENNLERVARDRENAALLGSGTFYRHFDADYRVLSVIYDRLLLGRSLSKRKKAANAGNQ